MKILLTLALFSIILLNCNAQNNPIDYVSAHKTARDAVGVSTPLVWDTTLATYAQAYAKTLVSDCKLVHSIGDYGENLALGNAWSDGFTGVDAVKLWVDEKINYDYATNTCKNNGVCGHYTQVIWKDSVRLGCARVTCKNGGVIVTCNYDPPGNYEGEKPY